MTDHPGFFTRAGPFELGHVAEYCGASAAATGTAAPKQKFADVKPLEDAGEEDLSFFDNRKYLPALDRTNAGAVFVAPQFAERVPTKSIALVTPDPYRAFAKSLELFYSEAGFAKVASDMGGGSALLSPHAEIEDGVTIEPGAIIGPEAQIGRGTRIAAGAVIGFRTAIGRDCYIGAGATVVHALIGNRVIVHPGVRIGQDGFGFALGAEGHYKVRQIGRVIVQDNVEIGANTAIDRGALRDTVIGEGTKIDNLVQIGHNVVIGRHCVIVSQTGISGSTILEDFVVLGGQVGTVGHIRIGAGAQVAAKSGVVSDIPPRSRWGGYPAKAMAQWAREVAVLKKLAHKKKSHPADDAVEAQTDS